MVELINFQFDNTGGKGYITNCPHNQQIEVPFMLSETIKKWRDVMVGDFFCCTCAFYVGHLMQLNRNVMLCKYKDSKNVTNAGKF